MTVSQDLADFWNDEEKVTAQARAGTDAKPAEAVNHPEHYNHGEVECIDAIKAATKGCNGYEGFCIGNAIKYLWRWKQKGGVTDLEKSMWYIDRIIKEDADGQG